MNGYAAGREDVAGADDVRSAEEDDAVAVGVRLRLVVEHDRFAVEVQVLRRREVFARAAGPESAAASPCR